MKKLNKYKKSFQLGRITHVTVPTTEEEKAQPLRIEAISAEPNSTGKALVFFCESGIWKEILGEREGNTHKLKLRGDQKHTFVARFDTVKNPKDGKDYSMIVGIDRIPLRFFDGRSGPVDQKTNRTEGFLMEWVEDHKGFKIDQAYLGMTRRDLLNLLEDLRKNLGNKRSYKSKCGHEVKFVDETTLRIKNPTPFTESTI